jgi:hypothetical protein
MHLTPFKLSLIIGSSVVLSIAIGVIIGFFSASRKTKLDVENLDYYKLLIKDDDISYLQEIIKDTNAKSISDYLE